MVFQLFEVEKEKYPQVQNTLRNFAVLVRKSFAPLPHRHADHSKLKHSIISCQTYDEGGFPYPPFDLHIPLDLAREKKTSSN